jgi:hypothetical protein
MQSRKGILALALAILCLGVIIPAGVSLAAESGTATTLEGRREQIADRQVGLMRGVATEEQKAPQKLVAILPVTGSLNIELAILVSTALGITLPFTVRLVIEKIRKSHRS